MLPRPRPRSRRSPAARVSCTAILLVDDSVWKKAAWQELKRARKRLSRAAADLHRHETKDVPAYVSWMHAACPALLSEVRQLHEECMGLAAQIQRVEAFAWAVGKPAAVVWQQYRSDPPPIDSVLSDMEDGDHGDSGEEQGADDDFSSDLLEDFLEQQGIPRDSPEAEMMRDVVGCGKRERVEGEDEHARDIYRRLVQKLHPDRGGEWTRAREALWHEVQRAWQAKDADWLARLESEHDIETETLSAKSALGRLYAAIEEVDAARRDADRKVRHYRREPAWRFTVRPRTDADKTNLAQGLREDRDHLQAHLEALKATLADWSRPVGMAKAKKKSRRRGTRAAEALPLSEREFDVVAEALRELWEE